MHHTAAELGGITARLLGLVRLPGNPGSAARRRLVFAAALACVYACVFVAADRLDFPPRKDELHFWPTVVRFSQLGTPGIEAFRNYNEFITPLSFALFGALERTFHGGIFAARLLNLTLSFTIACWIGLSRSRREWGPILSAGGLLAFPYYLGVSVHLYTDILAALLVMCGVWLYREERHLFSALALAIATRQCMVAFPAAIALHAWIGCRRQRGGGTHIAWIAPAGWPSELHWPSSPSHHSPTSTTRFRRWDYSIAWRASR